MKLNELPIKPWELEYIWNEEKISFVFKVSPSDLKDFIYDDTSEFFIEILKDDYLRISIKLLNVQKGTVATMDIQPDYKKDQEVVNNLKKLSSQDTVNLYIIAEGEKEYCRVLKVFDKDMLFLRQWLGEKISVITSSLKREFDRIPLDYMVPQKTDTTFWFLCKVNNNTYNSIKNNAEKIRFGVTVFSDCLALCLYIEKPFVAIYFSNETDSGLIEIDSRVREDFKLFLRFNTITFLVNNEGGQEETILNLSLMIEDRFKSLIREYMKI